MKKMKIINRFKKEIINGLSINIFLIIYLFVSIICQNIDINSLFKDIYSKMHILPLENRLIFGDNRTCIYDKNISDLLKNIYSNNNTYFCLFNKTVYMLNNQTKYIKLFDADYIENDFFYDFNIYKNESNIDCIISFSDKNTLIKFYHYIINISYNEEIYNNYTEYSFNVSNKTLSKCLSCHKLNSQNLLICFYSFIESSLYATIFNITNNFKETEIVSSNIISPLYDEQKKEIIRSSFIKDKNQFFVCKISLSQCDCIIYNYCTKQFGDLWFNRLDKFCIQDDENGQYNSYYFEESHEILLTCKNSWGPVRSYSIKEKKNLTENNQCQIRDDNIFYIFKYDKLHNIYGLISDKTSLENLTYECNVSSFSNLINISSNEKSDSESNSFGSNNTSIKSSYIGNNNIESSYIKTNIFNNITKIEIINISLNITKEQLLENISNLLNDKEIGQTYEIEGNDFTLLIYPTNSTDLSEKTHVNFEECESILREYYHHLNSNIITFFQIELDNSNSQSLINQLEYKVYDEQKNELDLSKCNNSNIKIYYKMKNNTILDYSKINSFKDLDVNIFDINDDFFKDVCLAYSDSGNDLILEDRIKTIYQNYSLCEEGCEFNEIFLENKTVSCECKVKQNVTSIISEINMDFIKGISSNNFEIVKCYNLVFSSNGKMKNIGFWIFSFLLASHIPFLTIYFIGGIEPVKEYLFKEMRKFGYIKNAKNNKITITKKLELKKEKDKEVLSKKGSNNYNPPPKQNRKETKNKVKNISQKGSESTVNKTIKNTNSLKNLNLIECSLINSIKKEDGEIVKRINFNDKSKYNKNNINDCENSYKFLNKNKSKSIKKSNLKLKNRKNERNNKKINQQNMTTQDNQPNKNNKETILNESKNNNNKKGLNFISINLNLSRKKKYIPQCSYITLYNYTMEEAMKYDRRRLSEIFYIFLLSKQVIFHTFLYRSPLEIFSLRICLLFFIISSDLALNAFFYFNDNISKKYRNTKNLILFTLSDNIKVILLSTLVGFVLLTIFTKLSNSTKEIRDVFKKEEEKLRKDKKYIVSDKRKYEIQKEIEYILKKYKIKVICFITIELMFMLFFWYYAVAFCHVYSSTQISWILDSLFSMLTRVFIDAIICFGLAKLYQIAINSEMNCLYKVVLFLYGFT